MELKIVLLIQLLVHITCTITTSEFYQESARDSEDLEAFTETEEREDEEENKLPEYNLQIPKLDPSNCQFQTIKKCNHKFKNMFHGRHLRAASSDKELYCMGIQTFMDCLEKTSCRGPFIDNYSYVVLQHGMMDKKTNYCPNHSYGKLVTKVKAIISKHRFIDDIGADSASACSAKTHIKCANVFTSNMKTNSNMCKDVQSFLSCYNKESTKCQSSIIQHFAHLCNKLGENMLKANEKHRGMMC